VDTFALGWSASSSVDTFQSDSPCIAWSRVLGLHSDPLWTLADRRGGSLNGDKGAGGLQNGEVGRLILTSHVVRNSLGGRVNRGGESCSGVSFHGVERSSSGCTQSAGLTAGFRVSGGSLVVFQIAFL